MVIRIRNKNVKAEQSNRRKLIDTAKDAYSHHLTCATLGTFSLRLSQTGTFLFTPLGIGFEDLSSEQLILVDSEGTIVEGTEGADLPLETSIFLNAYKARADVNAIAHLFPPYATAYSVRGKLFRLLTKSSQQILREVLKVECKECPSRFAGLCICNTDIRTSYSGVSTLLLKENGIITLGSDLAEALRLATLAEHTAKISFTAGYNHAIN